MKILQLSKKVPWPSRDGEAIAMMALTRSFYELGHEVSILSLNTRKHFTPLESIPAEIRQMASFDAVEVNTDVQPVQAMLNLFSGDSYNITRFDQPDFRRRLEEVLENQKFDLIQLEGLYLAPYLDTLRTYTSCPVTLRTQNVEHEIWERLATNQNNSLKKYYFSLLSRRLKTYERLVLNQVDAVVSISPQDTEKFLELGCNKPIVTIPPGMDLNLFQGDYLDVPIRQATVDGDLPSVFFIGALDWMPNQEGIRWFTEKVWPHVHKAMPQTRCYIAGRNTPPEFLKKRTDNLEFVGEVPDGKRFFTEHTVMVVPLLSGSGIRLKILEGMAMGKPIVATSVAAEGISYQPGIHLLIADKPKKFAAAITKCLLDPQLRQDLGIQARELIRENYDYLKLGRQLIEFFKTLRN